MNTIGHLIAGACLLALPHMLVAGNAGDAPLPPVETVLKRLLTGAAKDSADEQAFQQHYRYTCAKVTEYWKSDGSLKRREENRTVINPAAAPPPSAALPAAARMRSPKDTGQSGAVADAPSNERSGDFERDDFPLSEELLGRFQFTLAG